MTPVLPNGPAGFSATTSHDLNPYLVACIDQGTFEPALWRLKEGQNALALFTTQANADKYRSLAHPGAGWRSLQLPRSALIEVLKSCLDSHIPLAVMDPDGERAKLIFSLTDVIQSLPTEPKA